MEPSCAANVRLRYKHLVNILRKFDQGLYIELHDEDKCCCASDKLPIAADCEELRKRLQRLDLTLQGLTQLSVSNTRQGKYVTEAARELVNRRFSSEHLTQLLLQTDEQQLLACSDQHFQHSTDAIRLVDSLRQFDEVDLWLMTLANATSSSQKVTHECRYTIRFPKLFAKVTSKHTDGSVSFAIRTGDCRSRLARS